MERDKNGRFVKGKSGNPSGRPKKEREERYREILKEAVTFEDFRAIIKRMAEKAKRGDVQATRLLLEYLVGKPEQNVNVAGGLTLLDIDEWKKRQDQHRKEFDELDSDSATDESAE
jgi:hypothetical protein